MNCPLLLVSIFVLPAALSAQPSLRFGHLVTGDFNGDGKTDTCRTDPGKTGFRFSSSLQLAQAPGPWDTEVLLLNEGDLDGDGADDLSVLVAPNHGCTYGVAGYCARKGRWETLVPYFLWELFCEPFGYPEAQARVFRKGRHIYRLEWNPNEEDAAKAWHPVRVR